jgi:VanZ family protein
MVSPLRTSWRWWLWLVYVLAWTGALLMPFPGGSSIADLEFNLRFFIGKTLHVSAYAVLAALTAWLRAPMRWRFLLMFFLMVHATLTEVLQYTIESLGRSGELLDVALDHAGIAIGMLLTWRWWAETDKRDMALTPILLSAPDEHAAGSPK